MNEGKTMIWGYQVLCINLLFGDELAYVNVLIYVLNPQTIDSVATLVSESTEMKVVQLFRL